jgi:glycosyltransferase involved in cell wall biosynthesis
MKILITSIKYPGFVGVLTYIEQLVKGLKDNGHQVDLFAHNPILKNQVLNRKNSRRQQDIINYQSAAYRLPFDNYDIVHSQGIIPTIAVSRIKPPHIPLVMSLHGALTFNRFINGNLSKNSPYWQQSLDLESKAVSSSDICIVGSQWLKNVMINDYTLKENQQFAIVPYGIDVTDFSNKMNIITSITRPINKFVITCTARLVPLKGHKYLLESLAKLKRQRQDWVCWLIGDGPLLNELKQQAKRLGILEDVKFLGDQKNVPSLLNLTDLFVFPSLQDNLPYAVMEAQVAGVPVIVSDAGGIPEMVKNNETGIIVAKKDSNSLYHKINMLLDNVELRQSIANYGKSFATDYFAIEKMLQNTIAVYHQGLDMKKN